MRAAAVSLAAIAVGPAGTALAAPPTVTIASPLNGSVSNDRTPSFSGGGEEAERRSDGHDIQRPVRQRNGPDRH